ncbi:alpha/beta fold hydrolase [Rhizobium sp. TRM96647]|uniref:alpha/beta hydrolase family protein n=1 Tax=unclassified Rhizobium TaxID=2613769 RepID=UPI0021E78D0E|nr:MULTISPECIES: alpha/beta fold hydrolase [unclassified Rhizobium]MCV3736375.1 alpha/beta fold hydrolase [Rhizobium sp. TRM96647]MCV3758744.1 alpha/beta fold hydrolase [Rhizobium sp. TRM96650]
MRNLPPLQTAIEEIPVEIPCPDGVRLGGHVWQARQADPAGTVIVNAATGVLSRYYHRYARFLAGHGFDVLTYDYRGIGLSRPERLKGCSYRWRDWGERDFEGAVRFVRQHGRCDGLFVVGHSIGGFLPGLAESAHRIDRMLTVGAQYAWWGDYAASRRLPLFLKWHVAMAALTCAFGYFPGRRLGWLEDLPAGVAHEWSFRGQRFEHSHRPAERQGALDRMAAVAAPILAVTVSDDELGTPAAIRRTLDYYTRAERTAVLLRPADYGCDAIGHFGLFHDSHASGFWLDTLLWLRDGRNPWPRHVIDL